MRERHRHYMTLQTDQGQSMPWLPCSPAGCNRGGHRVGAGRHPLSDGVCHAVTGSDGRGAAALQPGHQAQVSDAWLSPRADDGNAGEENLTQAERMLSC